MKKNNSKGISRGRFDRWKAWLYLLPALILLLIFTVYPIFNTVRISFLSYADDTKAVLGDDSLPILDENGLPIMGRITPYQALLDTPESDTEFFFSLDNYVRVLTSDALLIMLRNTVVLCVVTVPLSTLLALLIAVCLNSIRPLRRVLQTIFFLPYVTNSIAIGMVFATMFNIVGIDVTNLANSESVGLINWFIGLVGIAPQNWVNQRSELWANYVVLIVYIIWNALPFKILILLGALQSVNKQYYDAAKVDSTPPWRVFTRITVPLLSPMISYVVITGFIGGFKEYSSIVGIFGDEMQPPAAEINLMAPRLQTFVGYIYKQMGNYEGEAAAAAIILFFIIFAVTLVNLWVSKKNTHYA